MKEQIAIQLYKEGCSMRQIASQLHIDRKRLSHLLQEAGINIRMQKQTSKRYTCNDAFFDKITTEQQAYWLGFIAADGFIEAKRQNGAQKVGVTLSKLDEAHVYALRAALEATNPILEYTGSGYNQQGTFVKLLITSQQMVDSLKQYGIIEQKTYAQMTLPPIPSEYMPHFIRGYYDGNGSTTIDKRRPSNIEVRITGNEHLLQAMQSLLPCRSYLHTYRNVGELRMHGRNAKQFLSFIYPQNTSVFLQRKYDKNMKYIER